MELAVWEVIGGVAGTALTVAGGAWRVARAERTKFAGQVTDALGLLNQAEVKIREWQGGQIDKERTWREQAEQYRREDQKRCDEDVRGLRGENTKLHDQMFEILKTIAEYRVKVHDMDGELKAFRQAQRPGGRRYLDPK